jgi:hypothetical protein
MSLACCTSRTKKWERKETADLEESNSPITGQQQKTHLTKSDPKHSGIGYESCGVHNANLQLLQSIFDLPPSPLRKANLRSAEEAISLNRVSAGVTVRAAPAAGGYSVVCSAN